VKMFSTKLAMLFAASFVGTVAHAATPLKLSSDVFVERHVKYADGTSATVLEKPNLVTPGDTLVFVVKYKNVGDKPASNVSVTNPMPAAVAFDGTSDGLEIVSVDGGKSWGFLNTLRVTDPAGKQRAARMSDVTHVKWNINQPLSVGSEGKLIFRGVVK
jgi:uncharacterized repeat protein (TIGR01451 family)